MKAVLISIRPQWCEKITSGEKTIEVRKSAPKEVPFKAYIYMTKKKPYMLTFAGNGKMRVHNGMVIGEFICDRVEVFTPSEHGIRFKRFRALYETCLTVTEMREYANGKPVYGWHISNLKVYDKPKELSELWGRKNCLAAHTVECWNCFAACREINGKHYQPLRRPPQSWCYIEETALWTNK